MDWESELEEVDMTDEEFREYYKALVESEGFDVPYYPHVRVPGMTSPIQNLDFYKEKLDRYVGLAIQQYNLKSEIKFEMVEFVKVNMTPVAGRLYNMTFKAKEIGTPPDYPTTTFQAEVYAGIRREPEVTICRKKQL